MEKFREEIEQTSATNKKSDELISQEETERKLVEKLEHELATKEHQIATLVGEKQKLQSTLIQIKETSSTQVREEGEKIFYLMNSIYHPFRFLILKMLSMGKRN